MAVLLLVLVGLQSLGVIIVLRSNYQTITAFNSSFKIFPKLDRNFHKSLHIFVSQPLLHSIREAESQVFDLSDVSDQHRYFVSVDKHVYCYADGINATASTEQKLCVCRDGFHGEDCGVPSKIWSTNDNAKELHRVLKRRETPRRIVYGLPLNHEFDLFEARMAMLYDHVDVFVLHEANVTNDGRPKEPLFFQRFQQGWLKQCQDKFVYIYQSSFPEEGYTDGKAADAYMRKHLGQTAFNERLKNYREDDLWIYTDNDELIHPELLTFLKLYDGYSEPVAFQYRWSIFGFFWTKLSRHYEVAGMTVGFFKDFYDFDASHVRSHDFKENGLMISEYRERGKTVKPFQIADDSGWHCSWCFDAEGIVKKLLDAPKSDYPRWGDYEGIANVDFVKRLIKHGLYFDREPIRGRRPELTEDEDPEFAPEYMKANVNKFRYLLENPYKNVTLERVHF